MSKARDLEFKPYVGRFFQFGSRIREAPEKAIVGKTLYGNSLKHRLRYNFETLPKSVFIIVEKRNHVRFLSGDSDHLWVPKTQIVPLDLPTYDGNPMILLEEFREFLVYCTDTKLKDFSIDMMTKQAMELLPKLDSLIDNQRDKIIPETSQ